MRSVQVLTLVDTATIHRRTYAADGMGGQTETVATSSAACRVAPASAAQVEMVAGQVAEKQVWRITFAAEADVRKADRLTVGSKQYEVLAVLGPESRETARITVCVERI